MLECVVNVSEGRDRAVLDALAAACGRALLDVHTDADHHRSVLTLGAADPGAVEAAAAALADAVVRHLDLRAHTGVHPRLGALDVVPFVALAPTPPTVAIEAAERFAEWLAVTHDVPVFRYDDADPMHRTLPEVRRDAFTRRPPDLGPPAPHPRFGATAVGARRPMVAVNVELATDDLALARAIAHEVRERDGGLPGVRALGFALASQGTVQVSMNLVDLERTGLAAACDAVRARAEAQGIRECRVELVGLVPASELARAGSAFAAWSGIGDDRTVEARVAAAGR